MGDTADAAGAAAATAAAGAVGGSATSSALGSTASAEAEAAAEGAPAPAAPAARRVAESPDAFTCPLTRRIFVEAVVADDGYTYERAALVAWIGSNGHVSPISGEVMERTAKLTPNRAICRLSAQKRQEMREGLAPQGALAPLVEGLPPQGGLAPLGGLASQGGLAPHGTAVGAARSRQPPIARGPEQIRQEQLRQQPHGKGAQQPPPGCALM